MSCCAESGAALVCEHRAARATGYGPCRDGYAHAQGPSGASEGGAVVVCPEGCLWLMVHRCRPSAAEN